MQPVREFDINGTIFRVPNQYELIKPIGHGAYGLVCSAKNIVTGQMVAIKKINNAFLNLKDTKRTLREIKLLRHFRHDNILDLVDIPVPEDRKNFKEVYIVTGLLETDLHQVISSNQPLTDKHVQYFLYQILRGVKHMHSANVLHRDLKPSNLLVNSDCTLKICDFGMARVAAKNARDEQTTATPLMTEYVATRWYRAPEVILSWKQYTRAIDIWSVGCIFAELLCRKPLFQGWDYMNQINRIIEVMGSPEESDLQAIQNPAARQYIISLGHKPGLAFEKLFPSANPDALDLLRKMLHFNPTKRITVGQGLSHPYLSALHEPADEPVAPAPFNFDFENHDMTPEAYRELIYQEVIAFHPEAALVQVVNSNTDVEMANADN